MGRVIPQMKIGSVDKMSIGYSIREKGADYIDDVRHLKDLKLWEVSLVTLPMNEMADVTDMKASIPFQNLPLADRKRQWDSVKAIGRIRAFTNSEDKPSNRYKRAFLWYDKENANDFGSYKLPIADIVNDRMVVVPRAMFAAAALMHGAKGDTPIPEPEKACILKNIERYYEKMDLESPFEEGSFTITSFKDHHPRDIESLLRIGKLTLPQMGQKQAMKFISALKQCDIAQKVKPEEKEDWSEILNELNEMTEV